MVPIVIPSATELVFSIKHFLSIERKVDFVQRLKAYVLLKTGVKVSLITVLPEGDKLKISIKDGPTIFMLKDGFEVNGEKIDGKKLETQRSAAEVQKALEALKDNVGAELENEEFSGENFGY